MGNGEAVRDELVRTLKEQNDQLVKVLEVYANCQHGSSVCFCTDKARAALYPILIKQRNELSSRGTPRG